MTTPTLDTFAINHHGLVTRRALEQSGRSRAAWYRALARGDYELLHPGVARVIGTAPSREQAIAAAVLAAGTNAMASHRSAAHVWGVPRPPDDVVDIILPGRSRHLELATLREVGVDSFLLANRPDIFDRVDHRQRDGAGGIVPVGFEQIARGFRETRVTPSPIPPRRAKAGDFCFNHRDVK